MRLFTGIAVATHVLDNIERLLGELRPLARLNWTPVENLHITSKFIGEWPEQKLAALERALGQLPAPGNIHIAVARFGFFPNPHHPRVLFAGVQAGSALGDLAKSIDEALLPLGCAREERPYSPHLTLAKINQAEIKDENFRDLREHIASMTNPDFGSFEAVDFHLYLSQPGPRGSVYSRLASYPLSSVPAVART
jgi:2'-5' RNA ligase